jgi:hypothetical protein
MTIRDRATGGFSRTDSFSDDAPMRVIGSRTSLEGDRWILGTGGDDGEPVTLLDVTTAQGDHSKVG